MCLINFHGIAFTFNLSTTYLVSKNSIDFFPHNDLVFLNLFFNSIFFNFLYVVTPFVLTRYCPILIDNRLGVEYVVDTHSDKYYSYRFDKLKIRFVYIDKRKWAKSRVIFCAMESSALTERTK